MKVRENIGPLSPISRKPLGILKFFLTQKVVKNYELSNDQKYTHLIFDILWGTVSPPFPRQYFGQIFP